jgi:CBS domain-containing protein
MKTTRRLTLQQTVGEVMSDTPVTLPPGARIRDAIRRFTDEVARRSRSWTPPACSGGS